MSHQAVHVHVKGRVQGVSYRASCAKRARELGVQGWVRNCSDGSVEATFAGEAEAVQVMLSWCEQGPPGAQVVEVSAKDADGLTPDAWSGFVVLPDA